MKSIWVTIGRGEQKNRVSGSGLRTGLDRRAPIRTRLNRFQNRFQHLGYWVHKFWKWTRTEYPVPSQNLKTLMKKYKK